MKDNKYVYDFNKKVFKYAYNFLTPIEQIVYDKTVEDLLRMEPCSGFIELESIDVEQLKNVFNAIMCDYPEIFYLNNFEAFLDDEIIGVMYEYDYSKSQVNGVLDKLNYIIDKEIVEKCEGKSELEKVIAIHDYLINTVDNDGVDEDYIFTILGAIGYKKAISYGISKAFKFICDKMGIDSGVVIGYIMDKQGNIYDILERWNVVRLNNEFSALDIDRDLSESKEVSNITYGCFLLDDDGMKKIMVPKYFGIHCEQSYDYYKLNNLYFDDLDKLNEFFNNYKLAKSCMNQNHLGKYRFTDTQCLSIKIPKLIKGKEKQVMDKIYASYNGSNLECNLKLNEYRVSIVYDIAGIVSMKFI